MLKAKVGIKREAIVPKFKEDSSRNMPKDLSGIRANIHLRQGEKKFSSSLGKRILIALIKFYQRAISPSIPHSCRFEPTCSQYSIEAIKKYGIFKGGLKSLWRIVRCNPFNPGGYDPLR